MGILTITSSRFIKRILLILVAIACIFDSSAQTTPFYPVSYRLFTPFVFNPAITGSKDFSSLDFIIGTHGESNSQIASGNFRLTKSEKEYFTSLPVPEFTNFGLGGYIFNESHDSTNNTGVGATGSYHIQLDRNALSFLSIGVSAKAIFNKYSGNPDTGNPAENTFIPNLDAGVYYYSPSFYAGISATNILGAPDNPDSLGIYTIPVSQRFFLYTGYKFVLSRSYNLLLEPSLIVTTGDSLPDDILDIIKPGLKIYVGNFCLGTYFNDFNRISFFGQYKYKKTYLGAYFELPYNSAYYNQPIKVEVAFGVNFSAVKSGFSRRNHW